ncbi:MAG: hypothetical protein IJZ27_00980 [Treponema sp.]|nr:hypothetical protein [Treponema sp.]
MYRICDNVKIRNCGELSFFVNIENNSLFAIQSKTVHFLLQKLKQGINIEKLKNEDPEFANFLDCLVQKNILEDDGSGI